MFISKANVWAKYILFLLSATKVKVFNGKEYKTLIEFISNFLSSFIEFNLILLILSEPNFEKEFWSNSFLLILSKISLLNANFSFSNKRFVICFLNFSSLMSGNFEFNWDMLYNV